jgi:hypothetical protein
MNEEVRAQQQAKVTEAKKPPKEYTVLKKKLAKVNKLIQDSDNPKEVKKLQKKRKEYAGALDLFDGWEQEQHTDDDDNEEERRAQQEEESEEECKEERRALEEEERQRLEEEKERVQQTPENKQNSRYASEVLLPLFAKALMSHIMDADSVWCILLLAPTTNNKEEQKREKPFTIVDFGGGSGHLGIPATQCHCCFQIVILLWWTYETDLSIYARKAEFIAQELLGRDRSVQQKDYKGPSSEQPPSFVKDNPVFRSFAKDGVLNNLFSFFGPVEQYTESFDMAITLHLCGKATNVTLRKAVAVQASSLVMAPCCVGKLSQKVLNPDIYHVTGKNIPTVSYPQSKAFCQLLMNKDGWDGLCKAADYSNKKQEMENQSKRHTADGQGLAGNGPTHVFGRTASLPDGIDVNGSVGSHTQK